MLKGSITPQHSQADHFTILVVNPVHEPKVPIRPFDAAGTFLNNQRISDSVPGTLDGHMDWQWQLSMRIGNSNVAASCNSSDDPIVHSQEHTIHKICLPSNRWLQENLTSLLVALSVSATNC